MEECNSGCCPQHQVTLWPSASRARRELPRPEPSPHPHATLGTLRGRQPLRDSGSRNQKSTFLFKWRILLLKYLCMYLSFCGPPAPLLWCFAPGKRERGRARGKMQGQQGGSRKPSQRRGRGRQREKVREGERGSEVRSQFPLWQGWRVRVPHFPWSSWGHPGLSDLCQGECGYSRRAGPARRRTSSSIRTLR